MPLRETALTFQLAVEIVGLILRESDEVIEFFLE